MRKVWWCGLVVAIAAPAAAQKVYSTAPEPPPEWAHARTAANLRAGPGTGAAVVGRLAASDRVEVAACDTPPGWCEVRTRDGRRVWVAADLLVRHGATAAPAPPTHIEIPPPAGPPVIVEVNPRWR